MLIVVARAKKTWLHAEIPSSQHRQTELRRAVTQQVAGLPTSVTPMLFQPKAGLDRAATRLTQRFVTIAFTVAEPAT